MSALILGSVLITLVDQRSREAVLLRRRVPGPPLSRCTVCIDQTHEPSLAGRNSVASRQCLFAGQISIVLVATYKSSLAGSRSAASRQSSSQDQLGGKISVASRPRMLTSQRPGHLAGRNFVATSSTMDFKGV